MRARLAVTLAGLLRARREGACADPTSEVRADDEAVFLPAGTTRTYRAHVDAVVVTEARYRELRAAEERDR